MALNSIVAAYQEDEEYVDEKPVHASQSIMSEPGPCLYAGKLPVSQFRVFGVFRTLDANRLRQLGLSMIGHGWTQVRFNMFFRFVIFRPGCEVLPGFV